MTKLATLLELDQLADCIADRVLERLDAAKPATGLVDAAALATALGVSRRYIYEHADELGAVRLGNGPRARLRFDLEVAREAMACSPSKSSQAENPSDGGQPATKRARARRRLPNGVPEPGSILVVRPKGGRRVG